MQMKINSALAFAIFPTNEIIIHLWRHQKVICTCLVEEKKKSSNLVALIPINLR